MWRLCVVVGLLFAAFPVAPAKAQRVLGLDVSAWQSDITTTEWATLKRRTNQQVGGIPGDGRDFVFIRSSRGGTTGYYNQNNSDNDPPTNTLSQRYDDPYFVRNITRATQAGLLAGAYHFSRPDVIASTLNSGGIANTGTDEANHFIQMAGPWMRPGYLLPVHDLEAGDGIRSDNQLAQFTLEFSDRIYEVMGIRPAIYINGNYAQNVIGGATASLRQEVVEKHPTLWIARWPNQANPNSIPVQTAQPNDSLSWLYGAWDDYGNSQPWVFWQYSSTMRLNGNNNKGSNTDVNVANGGMEFLKDQLVPALWMNNASGDWGALANWNSGQTPVAPVQGPGQVARVGAMTLPNPRLPGVDDVPNGVDGQNDTVILDRPNANITVTHSSGATNIRKLVVNETLRINGGSLTVNYVPSADSTPYAARFGGPVTLAGGELNVHTAQIDQGNVFTVAGGDLSFQQIALAPSSPVATKIAVTGQFNFSPLTGASAAVLALSGGGSAQVDLTGGTRTFDIANGAAAVDLSINIPVVNGSLVKTGPGTLALQHASTVLSEVTVEQGKLMLAGQYISDSADVHLSSGGQLELNLGVRGAETVNALYIDGVAQPAGIWGPMGSSATFTSPLLSGAGLLRVMTMATPEPAALTLCSLAALAFMLRGRRSAP